MYDDDRDALAAEYVLGTLSADERDQAEALLVIDPGFAEIVRQWERRLGELNVMVEAVEPPPEVWEKIRAEIAGGAAHGAEGAARALPVIEESAPQTAPDAAPETPAEPVTDWRSQPEPDWLPKPAQEPDAVLSPLEAEIPPPDSVSPLPDLASPPPDSASPPPDTAGAPPGEDLEAAAEPPAFDDAAAVAALASSLLPSEPKAPAGEEAPPPQPPAFAPPKVERSADVIRLARAARRWRRLTVLAGAIAALLAVYVGVQQFAPGLIPLPRPGQPLIASRPQPPATRFVAVLQHDPTAPAFLLTLDPQSRIITVRRVAAGVETDRSYELWLISSKYSGPRSLGVIGGEEFTARPIPASFDVNTLRGASYAISLEPAGGSPSGVPTGPILFTGKLVESVPASTPPPG
jgi:anti-sigma-K factor RskA